LGSGEGERGEWRIVGSGREGGILRGVDHHHHRRRRRGRGRRRLEWERVGEVRKRSGGVRIEVEE